MYTDLNQGGHNPETVTLALTPLQDWAYLKQEKVLGK